MFKLQNLVLRGYYMTFEGLNNQNTGPSLFDPLEIVDLNSENPDTQRLIEYFCDVSNITQTELRKFWVLYKTHFHSENCGVTVLGIDGTHNNIAFMLDNYDEGVVCYDGLELNGILSKPDPYKVPYINTIEDLFPYVHNEAIRDLDLDLDTCIKPCTVSRYNELAKEVSFGTFEHTIWFWENQRQKGN